MAAARGLTPSEDDTPTVRAKTAPSVALIILVALVGMGTCAEAAAAENRLWTVAED